MENCVFCKIIRGELPCSRVYEDDEAIAFMDIGPIVKGHILVVPKSHYAHLLETPPDVLKHLIVTAQKIAGAQKRALRADGINIMQSNCQAAGQVVNHIHFHVIPRFNADGHHWNWKPRPYADNKEMQALAEKIGAELKAHSKN
ncbi:MAG: HIT family protein [Kiritimatiellae bacterium]|nr:HIT family protein [Kiritimatiellia bacterium]